MKDETLILADQAEKAVAQVRESVKELLATKYPPDKAEELTRLLSEGTWTHDHPITFETAKSFGLPVRCDIPSDVVDLIGLYPQPVRRQPSVEYLPKPRRYEGFGRDFCPSPFACGSTRRFCALADFAGGRL